MAFVGNETAQSERIEQEATAWFVRLRNPQASSADREAFRGWLSADPLHLQAFREVEDLWKDLDAPAAAAMARETPFLAPPRARARRSIVTISLLAACLALIVWRDPGLLARARADHATPPGAQESVALDDGSTLVLDADSAVTTSFGEGRREVALLRGRAWFDVAHDPARPFLVHADALDVRVTGTAFAVDADRGVVTVERGSVSVAEAGDHFRLTAGQQAGTVAGRLAPPKTVDTGAALAWRRGLVVFDAAPLDEVFREMARMAGGRMVAPQAEVRSLKLSGVFRANDPASLLEAMRHGLGLRTIEAPGLGTLVYR